MNIKDLYKIYLTHNKVITDTRNVVANCIFFALRGPNFNGNTFAAEALANGAAYVVVDDPAYCQLHNAILVDDCLTTLQQLAKYHRQQFSIPFIAITGSNGKTTSKELVYAVLALKYTTYTTKGNLNNHIGVPLTILSIPVNAQMAVIEMGANHQQEIASYCTYTLPTHGVITNCGKAHLEGFDGVEGVKKGKGELYDYLRAHNGTAFVMQDYDYLMHMSQGIAQLYTYGTANANLVGTVSHNEPFLHVHIPALHIHIHTQLVGAYNLPNVLLAAAIGTFFQVEAHLIKQAIEHYAPSNSRSQLVQSGTNHIILDTYNANPSSMQLAIQNFAALQATNKILFIGEMAELGQSSHIEHTAIIELIQSLQFSTVILVGSQFKPFSNLYVWFASSKDAQDWYQIQNFNNAHILIKGSRSTAMEKVIAPL